MKYLILIQFLLFLIISSGGQQMVDSFQNKKGTPEVFTSGFIDVLNSGQVNASARILRLNIGEPKKFSIPISFYCGVSNNNFQSQGVQFSKTNDHLVTHYINPMSGLINISVDGDGCLTTKDKITKLSFVYQVGERLLHAIRIGPISDPETGKAINFLNGFGATGFLFETGAWEKTDSKNIGIFWTAVRFHISKSSSKQIKEFLPKIETNGLYYGYSIGFGIEINNLVNIKTIYYKYLEAPEIDYGLPIYQFSFNYQLKK